MIWSDPRFRLEETESQIWRVIDETFFYGAGFADDTSTKLIVIRK